MDLSLNEAEALCKKAARGAGYSWGMAEECARSARWLCRHGLDGCAYLANLLAVKEAPDSRLLTFPANIDLGSNPNNYQGKDYFCPVATGTRLLDSCDSFATKDHSIRIKRLVVPELLIMYVSAMARRLDITISMQLLDANIAFTDGVGVTVTGNLQKSTAGGNQREPEEGECMLQLRFAKIPLRLMKHAANSLQYRTCPNDDTIRHLNNFASLTYAPATTLSRQSGAGAGLVDND